MSEHTTMREILERADQNWQEAVDDGRVAECLTSDEPHDLIHEIADSNVPVMNSELLNIACDDNDIALSEPDIGPAFDGSPTPINIIAANIYEAIEEHLWERWRSLLDERADHPAEVATERKG